ncbi:protein inturned isoform X3 [Belonocnema kinseyi]|uniref:protein inturned isoform X3 n=1 Tax=Belonocnema kinseyi TaxID=2817044 RepID=UPI00143D07CE|nr:protein inturned isoform X3 [Belonocnema kinseyi]
MSEIETKLLLHPEAICVRETKSSIEANTRDDYENDWWASDSRSSTGSYYSDNESSPVAEWESEINHVGEVFYIESLSDSAQDEDKSSEDQNKLQSSEFTRRRSTRAEKLMHLIKRRESNRCSSRTKKLNNVSENPENMPKTQDKDLSMHKFSMGEVYQVMLSIDPERKHKLGRRASMCEAYLGIIPGISSDNMNILVVGLISDGEAIKNQCIKEGDYLCSINSRNVTPENLNSILSDVNAPINVALEFQRVITKDKMEKMPTINTPKQSLLVRRLIDQNMSKSCKESFLKHPFGIMFLKTTGRNEMGLESQDILYGFPRLEGRIEQTILFLTRGAFVTLNHMLSDTLGSRPISSTVRLEKEQLHITYTFQDDNLLLIALPDNCCSEYEANKLSTEIALILEFIHESLTKCFMSSENHSSLDHLFFLIYERVLLKNSYIDKNNLAQFNMRYSDIAQECEFETILHAAHLIRLSRDALIQIDAALNEMEAMDYKDWNEDPMDCQRLYTIIGSCLYHKSYLLRSHLPHDNLIQVHAFLRQNGLLNLVTKESLKSLIVWKKVYPTFVKQEIVETTHGSSLFHRQWFLLVIGYQHDLLIVLLESGGCTAKLEEKIGPDVFYVEEAQETLKHIQKIGISTLVEKWILANARPEVILPEEQSTVKPIISIAENLLGFIKSSETQNHSTKPSYTSPNIKAQEITPTSKRHSPEDIKYASGSVYSFQTSEDSSSQATEAVSELSDEAAPILGRRATREMINVASNYSDDSDSDLDLYRSERQFSRMEISDIRENLLHQAEYITPKVLTSGDKNYLFHYVYLDLFEGILISSTIDRYLIKNSELLTKCSRCAHVIHRLLQNTVRYKKMLTQDMDKSVINKTLVAIKEHGVLFDWNKTTYWVVGRMYSTFQAKEIYVCFQDSAPQNLVEMAFRLNSIG